jgi:NAD(P)-dependent dehydrogenase (short-subunit alcohol dehydrogenase family)
MSTGWSEQDPARVLVTGCSSGIGRALCADLVARGHEVIATARDAATLADVPVQARIDLDVTNSASVAAAVAAAGPVDVLVNNAGLTAWAPLEAMPIEVAQRVFDTNVWGTLRLVQAVAPAMRERGRGRIVNVSSASLRGYPLLGLYVASKSAMESMSEALRLELAGFGVEVVLAIPAAVVTSFGQNRVPVEAAPDYRDFTERAFGFLQGMRGTALSAADAAALIADLVEVDDPPLRTPIGADAKRYVPQRHTVSDEDFEQTVRAGLDGELARTDRSG